MDAETEDAIKGSFAFTRNIFAILIAHLQSEGANDEYLQQALRKIAEANETIPEGVGRHLADQNLAVLHALVLQLRQSPPATPQ